MNKRQFLKTGLTAVTGLSLLPNHLIFEKKDMNILFLGGRDFLGPTLINSLLEAGHNVTILNRGISNPHLFTDLPFIKCDREVENREGLLKVKEQIEDKEWDCVIDTWQKSPKAVSDFLDMFRAKVKHYHYISSIAVYQDFKLKGISEEYPIRSTPKFPETFEVSYPYSYRKALAEKFIISSGIKHTIYRCHGIKGERCVEPGNPNEEAYWPIRFLQGGEILVPDVNNHYMQNTDAIDLANFMVRAMRKEITGVFNVASEAKPFKEYITAIDQLVESDRKLYWMPEEFLKENQVLPYREIAYWRPNPPGFYHFDVSKANEHGLKNRSTKYLVKDQLKGFHKRYPEQDIKFGLQPDGKNVKLDPIKEQQVIEQWKNKLSAQG